MKEYHANEQLLANYLDLKITKKSSKIKKKLKNTGIFVYEDFCKDTMELREQLWEKVLEHRANNKIAYLNYRGIVVRNHRNVSG